MHAFVLKIASEGQNQAIRTAIELIHDVETLGKVESACDGHPRRGGSPAHAHSSCKRRLRVAADGRLTPNRNAADGDVWDGDVFPMGMREPTWRSSCFAFWKGCRTCESTTYQAVLRRGTDEGREEGRKSGRVEGGNGSCSVRGPSDLARPISRTSTIEAIQEFDRLEAIGDRMRDLGIQNWDDLLHTA